MRRRLIEVLRLLVVLFGAGCGYQASLGGAVPGPFPGVAVGVVLGSAVGYVGGGLLSRRTLSAVDRTADRLRDVPADSVVAGGLGAVLGVLVATGVGWPLFLVPSPLIAAPLFGFGVVGTAVLGGRIGRSQRDGVLALFGASTGVAPRPVPAAARPRVLDTSVAIDGRVVEVVRAGFLHGRTWVPAEVLAELQSLADRAEDHLRARGRRGLDTLEALRREPGVELEVVESAATAPTVDAALVRLCLDRDAALLTLDRPLARAAALTGVAVLDLHALALALRPVVTVGDELAVGLIKPGKEEGQAVAYLDDGTMIVVERARARIGTTVTVRVTSVVVTANGRLVFASPVASPADVVRPRAAPAQQGCATLPG